ncbi:ABC transporter substrate-binding protein [Nocardioides gilvus]|uniref:ABC transporter substrate-binding protein n=1 Tax=Nocardioides gilvus TaxID=1735589 RepID=UPI000D7427CD|nr:ABC transporter substrate-binding protein [Nocardioides gilvus]
MKKTLVGIASCALALSLVGCSEGSVDGGKNSSSADGDLRKVKVGLFPSSTVGAFQLGIDKGYFEERGIDLELVLGQSSAAQLPAVNTGSLDFVLASPTTPLVANSKGLDLRIVSGYGENRPEILTDSVAVMVGKDSPIKSAKDLEGKKVAINAVGSIGEIGIKEAVALDGGDPEKVTFIQLGFDQVGAQLGSGQIDAGMAGPPFMQQIQGAGGSIASDFIQEAGLGGSELVMVAGSKLVDEDEALVEDFVDALDETLDYAETHQDEVRDLLPEVIGTDPKVAAKTDFIAWDAELDVEALEKFTTLMTKYGVIDSQPDLAEIVWTK